MHAGLGDIVASEVEVGIEVEVLGDDEVGVAVKLNNLPASPVKL